MKSEALARSEVTRESFSSEIFRALIENLWDAVAVFDFSGKCIFVNKAAEKLTGYKKEEMLDHRAREVILGKYRVLCDRMNKLAKSGRPVPYFEVDMRRNDGTVVCVETGGQVIKKNGKPIGTLIIARDISDKKKAQEDLKESEQKFQRLFMSNPEAAVFWDKNFRISDINPRFTELFGYTWDEVGGKDNTEMIVPEERVEESRILAEKSRKGHVYHDTVRRRKDGSLVDVAISVAPMIVRGRLLGYVGLYKDITKRRQAEEALRESEEEYRNLFENARDLVLTTDLEGNITSLNRVVLEYGYDKSEVIGKNVFDLVPKEHCQQIRNGYEKAAQGNPSEGEFKVKHRSGKDYAVVEYRSNPIIQDKKVVGVQTIVRDITERKMLEEKLRHYSEHLEELVQKRTDELLESEKRYSVLVEEASDGVVIAQDGKIAFINKKGAEMVDYPRDELIGMLFEILVDEKHRQFIQEVAIGRLQGEMVPETVEFEAITKGSKRVLVEAHGTLIHYQGRPALLSILRDISDRRRMEEERSRLDRLAAIGELATMVAHDLRNPLTSIRFANFYLKNLYSKPNERPKFEHAREMFDTIEQETIFANNIVNELLDFAAKWPPRKKRQDLNKVIDDSLAKSNIPKNIHIKRKSAKRATIAVDGMQLERVFVNLTKNAVQAMPHGGQLSITTSERRDHVEITFTDTGKGITKENMNEIFQPLFTTKARGIGMGLAICKKIVEQHDGTIDVESKVGTGTTFTIKLPKKEGVIN